MARFMEIKSMNPRLSQNEKITKELGNSNSSVHRYRLDIIMLSPYRLPANSHKREPKTSIWELDLERPQMNSNGFKRLQLTSDESSLETVELKKIKLNVGGNIETNHEKLDEIPQNINLKMELAMRINSFDRTVRNIKVHDWKHLNLQHKLKKENN